MGTMSKPFLQCVEDDKEELATHQCFPTLLVSHVRYEMPAVSVQSQSFCIHVQAI